MRFHRAHSAARLLLAGFALVSAFARVPAADRDLQALLEVIDATALDLHRSARIENLTVEVGPATLEIRSGVLYPATAVAGRAVEMVFLGDAVIHLEPPDEIEAGQLELFTGARTLHEPVTEAVMVVCADAAATALLERDSVAEPDPDEATRAEALFARWMKSGERRLLDVRGAVLRDALGDPASATYFAGRFTSDDLGTFILLFDPDAQEQISLGQFVRATGTERERLKAERFIRRQQRRGRLLGLRLDDLGDWDQWVQTSMRDADGDPAPAPVAFEPTHYDLDIRIHDDGQGIGGRARIRLEAVAGDRRVITLTANRDVLISRVTDSDGRDLPFVQELGETHVFLPEAPAAGTETGIEAHFDGKLLLKVEGNLFLLRDTMSWYPHAGRRDRAPYDVRIDWPIRWDLVAAGTLVDGGQEDQRYWQRRKVELPVMGYTFEFGRFKLRELEAGRVKVTLALDNRAADAAEEPKLQFEAAVTDALSYFEDAFGPYPLDHLTVVTAPRYFGQGLLGFVTLPTSLAREPRWVDPAGVAGNRAVFIAHEIAHQWWGNVIGWKSYRDQWLSEAMADYASLLWARDRLPAEARGKHGAGADWQRKLAGSAADGRPLEEVGPIVLGARLSSTKADAYQPIVYSKGAVVLGMLSQVFGEKQFLELQRILLDRAKFRELSTEDYVRALEHMGRTDLGWFTEQYVYGTGVPEVRYRYAFEQDDSGGWSVKVTVAQEASRRRVCGAVRLHDGRLDVRCRLEEVPGGAGAAIIVPFQLGVFDPDAGPAGSGPKKKKGKGGGDNRNSFNLLLGGRRLLDGSESGFTIASRFEPRRFWLDRDGIVFGRFVDMTRPDKVGLIAAASEARATGDAERAVELFRRAAQLRTTASDGPRRMFGDFDRQSPDVAAWVGLAAAHLDLGDTGQAYEALAQASQSATGFFKDRFDTVLGFTEARIALSAGDHGKAMKLLDELRLSPLLGRRTGVGLVVSDAEVWLLLAIAAQEAGQDEVFRSSMEFAQARGADVSELAGP